MPRAPPAGPLAVRSVLDFSHSSRPRDRSPVSRCAGCDARAFSLGVGSERVLGSKNSGRPTLSSMYVGFLLPGWPFGGHSLHTPHDFISPWLWGGVPRKKWFLVHPYEGEGPSDR